MTSFRDYVLALGGLACAFCALFATARVRAEPLTALVRVAAVEDARLVERVRGQTGDLELRLLVERTAAIEPTLGEQMTVAAALARERGAAFAIWFVHAELRIDVAVFDVRVDRILVRSLVRAGGPLDQSAQEEAAALVVRSAVKASLLGDALGEPEETLNPTVAASAPLELPRPALPPPAPAPARVEPRWLLGAGLLGALDGATVRGHYGVFALLAFVRPKYEIGVRASVGLRADVRAQLADLALSEHGLGGYLGVAPLVREQFRLTLMLGASWRIATTRVRGARADFVADPQRASLATFEAETRLVYSPRALHGRVGLALSLGMTAYPTPLVLGYDDGAGGFVRVARSWPVQPLASIALMLPL